VSRGALCRGSVWVVFILLVGAGCTSIDDVGGGDSLADPPNAPVLDQSIPTQVNACDTPGCQNILLISGTKAARSGVILDSGVVAAPLSEVTTFSFDFELTAESNRVAIRAFDQDNQTSEWVYLDITLITAEEPGGEGSDPGDPTTGVDIGLLDLTNEADAFSSLDPKIAIGPNNIPMAVWQSCGGADACDRPRILASRKISPTLWATPTVISSDDIGSANALSPDLVVDSQGVAHIVWVDDGSVGFRGGVSDIIYRTWDGTVGGGLGTPETVTRNHIPSDAPVDDPAIGGFSNVIRAAYMARSGTSAQREFEVFEAAQVVGAAWTLAQVSSNVFDEGAGHSGATRPDIAVDAQGHSHIVWQNARKLNAEFTDRTDIHYFVTGASGPWVVNEPCDSGEDRNVHSPSLAVDPYDEQNRVYVAWVADGGCRAEGQARSIHLGYTEGAMGAFEVFSNPVTDFVQFGSSTNRTPVVGLVTSSDIPVAERFVVVGFVTGAALGESGDDDDVVLRKLSRSGSPVGTIAVVSESIPGQDTSLEKSRKPSCVIGDNAAAHCVWQEWDGADAGADYDIVYGVLIP
jgi:hypothetical protein